MLRKRAITSSVPVAIAGMLLATMLALAQDNVFLPTVESPRVVYVNHGAVGANDGTSWTDAYADLQEGLQDAVAGEEIWVALGVYRPGPHVTDSFHLLDDVAILGGFPGTPGSEDDATVRDPKAFVTVLSGDIAGDDVTDVYGIVTDTDNISGTNSYHVVSGSGVTATAELDGFTITAGRAAGECPLCAGGGLYSDGGGATLVNVRFSANDACGRGGGLFAIFGSPVLTNVAFISNTASSGGGMFCEYGSPVLTNVTFAHNAAGTGGGLYCGYGNPTLTDVVFTDNAADNPGGGMYSEHGSPRLTRVIFLGNSADEGGGMYSYGFRSDPALTNVAFSRNLATDGRGGGFYIGDGGPVLVNATFSGNVSASKGGAIYQHAHAKPGAKIHNSIVWGELPYLIDLGKETGITITHSDVRGGWPGTGNLDADPLFVDTVNDDLRLQPASPVINAGDKQAIPLDISSDLDGSARIRFGQVDMGAYEARVTAARISSAPPLFAQQDIEYRYRITTDDPDDPAGARSITAATRPSWLSWTDHGDGTAALAGTPREQHIGQYAVELMVEDADAYTATQRYTITVLPEPVSYLPRLSTD